jgi:deoxyribodipyrimidine photo-lyase
MVHRERITVLGGPESEGTGPVVYWMNRDCRIHDNWAYQYARELGKAAECPVLVAYNLSPGFLSGGYRQHVFKVRGLMEVEEQCAQVGTPFFLVGEKGMHEFLAIHKARAVVTDFSPLRTQQAWVADVVRTATCRVYEIDAHNIVPVKVASTKAEFAARTIRPKIHRRIAEFLDDFPRLTNYPYAYTGKVPAIDWDAVLSMEGLAEVPEATWITPGYTAGMRALHSFVEHRLEKYADARNDPNQEGQSGLSPYFHYGQIAPQRAALLALRAHGEPEKVVATIMDPKRNGSAEEGSSLASFLEELIVRRELADNFCFYTKDYDRVEGFPAWAQATLAAHRGDAREYVYTRAQFEHAKTHDELWNAAQREMTSTGKMHGYLRMYWAKKILEWTASPEDAMKIAMYLNDKYELDGRDPNGYVGISWSIGGTHDRPWFTRPIFGTVRYMARSGCEKKFSVADYIKRFS